MVIISELLKMCYCPVSPVTAAHQTMTNDISMSIGPCVNYLELAGEYIYNLNVPPHISWMCPYLNLDTVSQLSSIVKQTNTKKLNVFFSFTIITNYQIWFHNQLTIYDVVLCALWSIDSGLCNVTIQKSVIWSGYIIL